MHLTNSTMPKINYPQCTISQYISVTKWCKCGIWVWCIVGFVQWVYWLIKILFLVNKFEFLGIKRSWIEKTYTIDMVTWFLFTANKNAFFNNSGTRLAQRAETGFFDPVVFTAGWHFSTKLRNVAPILYTLYLRHFLINMSFCLNYARGWPRAQEARFSLLCNFFTKLSVKFCCNYNPICFTHNIV